MDKKELQKSNSRIYWKVEQEQKTKNRNEWHEHPDLWTLERIAPQPACEREQTS